jgi:flagellar motor switch protein FliG
MTERPERGQNARKAAIALLALQEDVAAAVLARLGPGQVRRLRQEMQSLGDVSDEQVAEVLEELGQRLASPIAVARLAGPAYLMKLAHRAFGEARAEELFAAPPPVEPEPIDRLRSAKVVDLAQLLGDENPQVAAIQLTQLPPALAGKVLAAMAADKAAELVARLAEVREVSAHAVAEASQALVSMLEAAGGLAASEERASFDGLAFSARVMRELAGPSSGALLEQLALRDRRVATMVRAAVLALDEERGEAGARGEAGMRAVQRGAS